MKNAVSELESEYKGLVFGTIEVETTKEKAIEIAKNEMEKVIMILQFFSPAAADPTIPCYFNIKGRTLGIPSTDLLIFEDGNILPSTLTFNEEIKSGIWELTYNNYSDILQKGLARASEILKKQEQSELEELILTCISIYVHGIRSGSLLDKFVFTLSAIETLLLSDSESIQSNVSLRLSFLSAETPGKRKNVIDNLRKSYDYRSKYLHHGKKDGDDEVLKILQKNVWTAINTVIRLTENIVSKVQLMELINQNIYS